MKDVQCSMFNVWSLIEEYVKDRGVSEGGRS